MAARLTDRQKKKILADYVQLGSYNAVAKMNGISNHTVKRVVQEVPELSTKIQQKKEENTADMMAYMDSIKADAQGILATYMKSLVDPSKIEDATLAQIATAFGIVVDKFTKNTASGNDSLHKLDKLLEEFKDAVKP